MFDITWCETFAAPTFIKKEYLSSFIRMSFLISAIKVMKIIT